MPRCSSSSTGLSVMIGSLPWLRAYRKGQILDLHHRATRHSVLIFSVSVIIAAENSRIPALQSDTGASGTGSSNPACSSGESANSPVPAIVAEGIGPLPRLQQRAKIGSDRLSWRIELPE